MTQSSCPFSFCIERACQDAGGKLDRGLLADAAPPQA
jgi:hypothetical protein